MELPTKFISFLKKSSLLRIKACFFICKKFPQSFGEAEEAALYMRTMMDEANLVIQVRNDAVFSIFGLFVNLSIRNYE